MTKAATNLIAVYAAYACGFLASALFTAALFDIVPSLFATILSAFALIGWAVAVVYSFRSKHGLISLFAIIPFLLPAGLFGLFVYSCGFHGSCL